VLFTQTNKYNIGYCFRGRQGDVNEENNVILGGGGKAADDNRNHNNSVKLTKMI
jgi:hypothetical protein